MACFPNVLQARSSSCRQQVLGSTGMRLLPFQSLFGNLGRRLRRGTGPTPSTPGQGAVAAGDAVSIAAVLPAVPGIVSLHCAGAAGPLADGPSGAELRGPMRDICCQPWGPQGQAGTSVRRRC